MWYVYELVDPTDGIVFYVGKGTGNRFSAQWKYLSENDESMKARKIRKILEAGQVPTHNIVSEHECEQDAFDKEVELIAHYGKRSSGTGCLTNLTDGGTGGDTCKLASPTARKARYDKRRQTMKDWSSEKRAKVSANHSAAVRKRWAEDDGWYYQRVYEGIQRRDKKAHARAISAGYKKQTSVQKKASAEVRSASRKELWQDPTVRVRLLAGARAVSKPCNIHKPDGSVHHATSLLSWCTENNESYAVLSGIREGKTPKTSRSKYYGWSITEKD